MKKLKKTRKKYMTGTSIKNYIDDPAEINMQNQINVAKAQHAGATDPLSNILKIVGNTTMNAGLQMGGFGGSAAGGVANDLAPMLANAKFMLGTTIGEPPVERGLDPEVVKQLQQYLSKPVTGKKKSSLKRIVKNVDHIEAPDSGTKIEPMLNFMAYGGSAGNVPVEIEGKEVGEMPNGEIFEAKGPSHEAGGIDVDLPAGTEMYSKRIKIDGETMAERKKGRKKKEMSLEELMSENNGDGLLKNSYTRLKKNNEKINAADEKIQNHVKQIVDAKKGNHAFGSTVTPPLAGTGFNPSINSFLDLLPENFQSFSGDATSKIAGVNTPTPELTPILDVSPDSGISSDPNKSIVGNKLDQAKAFLTQGEAGRSNTGDIIGILGQLYSPFKQKNLTLENRAGDTVNPNFFKDFGEAALETNADAQTFIKGIQDNKKQDVRLAANAATRRNRNSARGVNQLRALDLATDQNVGKQNRTIDNEFATAMTNLLAQRTGLQNQSEVRQASGAQAADIANRQDRDNFFTQLAQNESDLGTAFQHVGKDLNHRQQQDMLNKLMQQMSQYFDVDAEGNIINKTSK